MSFHSLSSDTIFLRVVVDPVGKMTPYRSSLSSSAKWKPQVVLPEFLFH